MIASLSSLTPEARQVLVTAQDEARFLRHGYVGTEHLLIALLVLGAGAGVERLTAAGVSADDARDLARGAFEATGKANPYIPDDKVLASVGVDLDAVRRRTEATFGSGALPGRVGSPPFTARAGACLLAATERPGAETTPDDLLAGILADPDSVATRALLDEGVDIATLVPDFGDTPT